MTDEKTNQKHQEKMKAFNDAIKVLKEGGLLPQNLTNQQAAHLFREISSIPVEGGKESDWEFFLKLNCFQESMGFVPKTTEEQKEIIFLGSNSLY